MQYHERSDGLAFIAAVLDGDDSKAQRVYARPHVPAAVAVLLVRLLAEVPSADGRALADVIERMREDALR